MCKKIAMLLRVFGIAGLVILGVAIVPVVAPTTAQAGATPP
jgi:hypothetical protein